MSYEVEVRWYSEEDRRTAFELLRRLREMLLREGEYIEDYMPFGRYGYQGYFSFLKAVEDIAKTVCCGGIEKEHVECRYNVTMLYKIWPDGTTEIYIAVPVREKLHPKPVVFNPRHLQQLQDRYRRDEYIAWFLLEVTMRVCEARSMFF